MVATVEIQEVNVKDEAGMTTGTVTSLTFADANPDTITINGGGTWVAGVIPGSIVRITSATAGGNNGDWTVASGAGTATVTLVAGDALTASASDTTAVIAGEIAVDKTSGTVRFKNADNSTVDTANPLVIPTVNTEYSYEKWLKLRITGTGPDTQITNVEFYMDGAKGWAAGVKLWGRSQTNYVDPAAPTETNDPPQIPVNGTPAAATDAFTWTAGSPLSLGAGPYTTANTDIGDFIVLVLEVEIGSTQGTLTSETATFEYDEI